MNPIPDDDTLTEAQELIWALLDEQISDDGFRKLERLLQEDDAVRKLYIQCVQIHVDLQQWFDGGKGRSRDNRPDAPIDLPAVNADVPWSDPAV